MAENENEPIIKEVDGKYELHGIWYLAKVTLIDNNGIGFMYNLANFKTEIEAWSWLEKIKNNPKYSERYQILNCSVHKRNYNNAKYKHGIMPF